MGGQAVTVEDIGVPANESGTFIEGDRTGVRSVDVQHCLAETAITQMLETKQEQGSSQAATLRAWIDREHVYLADRVVVMVIPMTVDLRPMRADDLIVHFCEEEPGWVEPRFGDALCHVCSRPATLIGQVGECARIQR
jgi:hypothetical protein